MKIIRRTFFAVLLALPVIAFAQSREPAESERPLPRWNIKTNLLYDATTTFNVGFEFRMGGSTTLDIPVNYNPWTFKENRKWKHLGAQPEFRWWPKGAFNGHFWGLHGHYAFYNIGNLPSSPFSTYMKDHRFEGWLAGVGVSYGRRWALGDSRWSLEATVGVGYAYKDYDIFECGLCGEQLGSETKHYFGPTKVGLSLAYNFGRKPAPAPVAPVYVPEPEPDPEPIPVPVYEPQFAASFLVPEVEAVKARSESGRAFLDFAVGRSEIVTGFRNNAAELRKIHTTIESIRNNPDATITAITITGYASPEGSASSNQSLSGRRAEALRNHIGSVYALPYSIFSVYGAGEDWTTLDSLVNATPYISERYQMLEAIRGTLDPDMREQRLKQAAGASYPQIREHFFPQLRRSDYTITYTVIPFSVEQGKEVLKTRPGSLSLNEMYLIANTYTPGSAEFNEVFEIAARAFPDSDVAYLNAAASALNRRDVHTAARYLSKVRNYTPEYWNNAGLLSWLLGDKPKAAEAFDRAAAVGIPNAIELDKHMQSLSPR